MIVFGLAFLTCLLLVIHLITDDENFFLKDCTVCICIVFLIIIIIAQIFSLSQPTALDVYREETLLEVKTINGIPSDSTVVWKERTVDTFYKEFKVDTLKN